MFDSHDELVNRGRIKGQLPLEHVVWICKTSKKITKKLGFHLIFKTRDLQDVISTTIGNDINVTNTCLYLYVPVLIPNSDAQGMFIEFFKNNYTITYGSWYTERKVSTDGNEVQADIDSAQHVISPESLNASFQTAGRIATPNKNNNIAFFHNFNVKKKSSK